MALEHLTYSAEIKHQVLNQLTTGNIGKNLSDIIHSTHEGAGDAQWPEWFEFIYSTLLVPGYSETRPHLFLKALVNGISNPRDRREIFSTLKSPITNSIISQRIICRDAQVKDNKRMSATFEKNHVSIILDFVEYNLLNERKCTFRDIIDLLYNNEKVTPQSTLSIYNYCIRKTFQDEENFPLLSILIQNFCKSKNGPAVEVLQNIYLGGISSQITTQFNIHPHTLRNYKVGLMRYLLRNTTSSWNGVSLTYDALKSLNFNLKTTAEMSNLAACFNFTLEQLHAYLGHSSGNMQYIYRED